MKASHKAILWIAIPIITIVSLLWWNAAAFAMGFLILLLVAAVAGLLYMIYGLVLDKIESIEYEKKKKKDHEEWAKREIEEARVRRLREDRVREERFGSGSYHTQPEVKVTFRSSKPTTDSY